MGTQDPYTANNHTMKHWQNYSNDERLQILDIASERKGLPRLAVEKDWWVTMVLEALSRSTYAYLLSFKGGTSLSKGWQLMERFSEDIDIALKRSERFAIRGTSHTQLAKVRRTARHYIVRELPTEIETQLSAMGIADFSVEPEITRPVDGQVSELRADAHPSVVYVNYKSVVPEKAAYLAPRVKIEISCLSMDEPVEEKIIRSFISETVDGVEDVNVPFMTVVPTRTFLEKIFLLHEEFQKEKPRYVRMSRHLYDLWKIMATHFCDEALSDSNLYEEIVTHRRLYNNIRGIDYESHRTSRLQFLPPKSLLKKYEDDYNNMRKHFIYDQHAPSFQQLLERLGELQETIHKL